MEKQYRVTYLKRGNIYLVNFDPTLGSEVQKTRPALILQNDTANQYSPITIVAALTSKFDDNIYPTEVFIKSPEGGLGIDSVILLNQIRSIDKQRLVKRIGKLDSVTMIQVDYAIQISLGLVEI